MKREPMYDLSALETTREEHLHGTPTVSLADALAQADEDAEGEE